jgi:hypothetical protein
MTDLRDAARQALEALEELNGWQSLAPPLASQSGRQAAINLRAALAAPARPLCKGIPRRGCNYLNPCDTVCNKCGEIHHHHQMVAHFEAAQQPGQVVPYAVWRQGFDAVRKYKEQPEQAEPVVWGVDWGSHGDRSCCTIIKQHTDGTREVVAVEYAPSYTHPPRREWRSLSEEEIKALSNDCYDGGHTNPMILFARAIEAAHGIKENT